MSEEQARSEAWHEARRVACFKVAQILAKANASRPRKQSILELNLAEERSLLEETKPPITPTTVEPKTPELRE